MIILSNFSLSGSLCVLVLAEPVVAVERIADIVGIVLGAGFDQSK
jgi:hypothetical protein